MLTKDAIEYSQKIMERIAGDAWELHSQPSFGNSGVNPNLDYWIEGLDEDLTVQEVKVPLNTRSLIEVIDHALRTLPAALETIEEQRKRIQRLFDLDSQPLEKDRFDVMRALEDCLK